MKTKTTHIATLTLVLFSLSVPRALAGDGIYTVSADSVAKDGTKEYMTTTTAKSPIDTAAYTPAMTPVPSKTVKVSRREEREAKAKAEAKATKQRQDSLSVAQQAASPTANPTATTHTKDAVPAKGKEKTPRDYAVETINENSTGDLFQGYSKTLDWDRMIPPYALEVTYDKTVHILFPAPIRYVDLGNESIIAGIAGDLDNVLRVKSATPYFEQETNLAVATDDGRYYSFNVKYAPEPLKLNVEMHDFIHDGTAVNRPNNSIECFLHELQNESPSMVRMIMRSIHEQNTRLLRHIGSKAFGIQFTCKGIYTYNNMIYIHTEIRNSSSVPFKMDYLTFKVLDRQMVRRTTIQETTLTPVRTHNYMQVIKPKESVSTVFAFPLFSIPREKVLRVDLHEVDGGRNQIFDIENHDLTHAKDLQEYARFIIN